MEADISDLPDCEISLCTLALVKSAIRFWESSEIRTEIRNYFTRNEKATWTPKTFHEITRKVLNLAEASHIPAMLPELKDAILNTGVKMYNWVAYMCSGLKLDASYAEQIYWTPLGFVDEVKIFKEIWVNDPALYEGSPFKPIFRLACLLAQEGFIREHQDEMIEELKKLPMPANTYNVNLEVENFSDKVYGIICTYICYFVYDDWQKKERYRREGSIYIYSIHDYLNFIFYYQFEKDFVKIYRAICQLDDHIFYSLERAHNYGILPEPFVMVRLCSSCVSVLAVKYFYNKLSTSQKLDINMWTVGYFVADPADYKLPNFKSERFMEIVTFIDNSQHDLFGNVHWKKKICHINNYHISKLLYYSPLQGLVWNKFTKWLNSIQCNGQNLIDLLSVIQSCVIMDLSLGLPIRRYIFQKLLQAVWAKTVAVKIRTTKSSLLYIYINLCMQVEDISTLKRVLSYCPSDPLTSECYLSYMVRQMLNEWVVNFELSSKFFNEMFPSSEDRFHFFINEFKDVHLLTLGKFNKWEEFYNSYDFCPGLLRDSIDPIKCLFKIAMHRDTELCDKFIKWWHESEEDQLNLKEKFKTSSYSSEIIYWCWLHNGKPRTYLKWLFDHDDVITQFVKEKLSILGLLEASFKDEERLGSIEENQFHTKIVSFINFYEITPETVEIAKEEIRRKIEIYMLDHSYVFNISTLDFLMDWTSVGKEDRKNIFKKLYNSGKLLRLCEGIMNTCNEVSGVDVFYNKWLKLYVNISNLKNDVISLYEAEREENFISELSLMFEKLERGEDLNHDEVISDWSFYGKF